jgi:hypothetical protein
MVLAQHAVKVTVLCLRRDQGNQASGASLLLKLTLSDFNLSEGTGVLTANYHWY